jgi:hypothetical protein
MNSKNNAPDISYYRLSLTDFLRESHPELLIDNAFIAERSEAAAETYSQAVLNGSNQIEAYCLQLVPDKLLTKDLCRTAVQSPNADDFVKNFVSERFPSLKSEQTLKDGKMQRYAERKLKI